MLGCMHQGPSSPVSPQTTAPTASVQARRELDVMRRKVELLDARVLKLEQELAATHPEPPTTSVSTVSVATQPSSFANPDPPPISSHDTLALASDSVEPEGVEPFEDENLERDPSPAMRRYRLIGSELVEATLRPAVVMTDGHRGGPVKDRYERALKGYRQGKVQWAAAEFERIVRRFPRSSYADNALYWKGEAVYDQGRYAEALAAFSEVIERYAGGNKAADALLKIGLCYDRLGERAHAQDVLTQLIAAYPGSTASDIARVRLAELQGTARGE